MYTDGVVLQLNARLLRLKDADVGTLSRTSPNPDDGRLRAAVDYLESRLNEDVGVAPVAAAVGYSVPHLRALFKIGLGGAAASLADAPRLR